MTEFCSENFKKAKEGYTKEHDSFDLLTGALEETLGSPSDFSKADLAGNCATLSFLELCAASVEAERGNKTTARTEFDDAVKHLKQAHLLNAETGDLQKILGQVELQLGT